MRKGIMFLILVVFLLPNIPITKCFNTNLEVYPKQGNSETKIFIYVSGIPYRTSGAWSLYVFWDDLNIIQKKADIYHKDRVIKFEHRWEVTITPPTTDLRYTERGTHSIKIWVMNSTGYVMKRTTSFKITKQLPQVEWWNDLSDEFIERIKGERGERGEKGEQGEALEWTNIPDEIIGRIKGEKGNRGEMGKQGVGLEGERGERGEKGEIGDKGDIGKSYPVFSFNLFCLLSILSLIISLYLVIFRMTVRG